MEIALKNEASIIILGILAGRRSISLKVNYTSLLRSAEETLVEANGQRGVSVLAGASDIQVSRKACQPGGMQIQFFTQFSVPHIVWGSNSESALTAVGTICGGPGVVDQPHKAKLNQIRSNLGFNEKSTENIRCRVE